MSTMWRKAMVYLGLGPDEEYDDYDVVDEPVAPVRPTRPARPQARPARPQPQVAPIERPNGPSGSVRTLPPPRRDDYLEPGEPQPRPQVVRPIQPTPAAKPHVVSPSSFNDVQEVADKFKASQPVIFNLQGVSRDLSRRLIDFSSGLCYGLGGQMERVADQVYLLTPSNVEVSAEERRRLQERGLVDR